MKKQILRLSLVLFSITSCVSSQEKIEISKFIHKVETHLTPKVIIKGEPDVFFNIAQRMEYYKIPGLSIAIINDGKIQWAKGYGYTSFDSIQPINQNTLFQAASISKPVAALATLKLVQDKKAYLDNNVNEYLKEWKVEENEFTEKEKVTIRRLLSHSAGLSVHGFRGYAIDEDIPTIMQVLNGEKPANSDSILPNIIPGSKYRYSGGGYTVIQHMATDMSGIPFQKFMKQTVLEKIGMNNSTYSQPLPDEFHNITSFGHRRTGDLVKGRWHTYPEMAAAGLWTTPTDLAKFTIEIQKSVKGISNKIISKEFAEKMTTRNIENYGLGFGIEGKGDSIRFVHGGANEGYRCRLVAFKNLDQGVIIMTNSDNGGKLISELLRSLSWTYDWGIYNPIVKSITPIDDQSLNKFVGRYKIRKGYEVELVKGQNCLVVKKLWNDSEYTIYPESEYKFFKQEDANSIIFEKDSTGIIKSYTINGRFKFNRIK